MPRAGDFGLGEEVDSEAFSMRRPGEAAGVCGGRGELWDLNVGLTLAERAVGVLEEAEPERVAKLQIGLFR